MDKRDIIISLFPNLAGDNSFDVTSPQDINYNCIAWAYGRYKDKFMQPYPTGISLDGVTYWWPDGVTKDRDINAFIEAFEKKGFVKCDNFELEKGFIKIALYVNPITNHCLHAARQKISGIWESKLGPQWDIVHGTPFSLDGSSYGVTHCCMKTKY